MDFPISVPSIGLVDGKFVDEDPLSGSPGSLIPAAWGNAVTLEVLNVIEAAGLSPDEENNAQLLQAINAMLVTATPEATETVLGLVKHATQLQVDAGTNETAVVAPKKLATAVQNQTLTAFATAGTATALTLAPTPAIQAYATSQRFNVKFSVTSGLNPTLNVSAKGAKSLKQYDSSGAKVAAAFIAGQISDVVYDGTDWVVANPLAVGATTTVNGVGRFGTSAEQLAGALATVMSNPAGVLALLTAWFPKRTFAANDYIRLPDIPGGLIIQWGNIASLAVDTAQTVTFSTAFPNLAIGGFAGGTRTTGVTGGNDSFYFSPSSLSQGVVVNDSNNGAAMGAFWIVFGY